MIVDDDKWGHNKDGRSQQLVCIGQGLVSVRLCAGFTAVANLKRCT